MTSNTQFKKEANELLGLLIKFQRHYVQANKFQSTFSQAEHEVRTMLYIARTDEENRQQEKEDSYC